MKKTLVALAVAAFATSASALTVYENEGTKVDMNGKVRVILEKETDKRPDLKNDGSGLSFSVSHKLSDDVKVIGAVATSFKKTVETDEYYVGFDSKSAGKLTFGNHDTSTAGLDKSGSTTKYGGVGQTTNSGEKAITYASPSFGGFSFGAHYLLGNTDKKALATKASDGYSQGFGGALKFEHKVEDLKFAVNGGFTQENYKTAIGNVKRNAFIASTGVENDMFKVGVTYTEAKTSKKVDYNTYKYVDNGTQESVELALNKLSQLGVGAKVVAMKQSDTELALYGHYTNIRGQKSDKSVKLTANKFVVGTSYKFHKQASTFVDFMTVKGKVNNTSFKRDNKVGVGLRVWF
ncbi:MAG: porin [Pasteurellaceae bacterium]|nr:porin [Pasteurellaceae bacterium]